MSFQIGFVMHITKISVLNLKEMLNRCFRKTIRNKYWFIEINKII